MCLLTPLPGSPWDLVEHYCDSLLGNRELASRLRAAAPTVALVDLLSNECGLALAHNLGGWVCLCGIQRNLSYIYIYIYIYFALVKLS